MVTLASKYGVANVAKFCTMLLASSYGVAITLPYMLPTAGFNLFPMTIGHSILLSYFVYSYSRLDATDMSSVKKFYKAIWSLFYLEYCLYPFI